MDLDKKIKGGETMIIKQYQKPYVPKVDKDLSYINKGGEINGRYYE